MIKGRYGTSAEHPTLSSRITSFTIRFAPPCRFGALTRDMAIGRMKTNFSIPPSSDTFTVYQESLVSETQILH